MIVKNILQMKPKGLGVVFIAPDATVADAAKLLAKHRIGALVVVEGGGLIAGILSERDIVRGVGEQGNQCLSQKVRELMTANVLTCTEGESIDSLMQTMTERRIRHLPVVDAAKRLIGIVTIGDVVKNKLEMAKMEVEGLRDYVAAVR
jgi:CBS domain-containing protein